MKQDKPQTRQEIEAALARLRLALAQAGPDSPAGTAFAMAIRRKERALTEIGEASK